MMRFFLMIALILSACSSVPRLDVGPVPVPTTAWLSAVDWPAAASETTAVLAGYLRTDTTNPPGRETAGALYLAELLKREGIASELLEFAPGRHSLLARLPGRGDAKPLCLVSHIDVVTAEAAKWPADRQPLSGVIADGALWGRGALDMKGMGALEVMTMIWLKRLQVPLRRDVVLLAVGDEEVDNLGMKDVISRHWARIGCSQSINEGGLGVRDAVFPGQTFYAVSVAEKGLLWLKMTAHGPSGHGSTPIPGRAPERLLRAIDKLAQRDVPTEVHPSLRISLAQTGWHGGGLTGWVLRHPALWSMLVVPKLLANPASKAALTNTVHVTGFAGGFAPNVVPSEVSATLDCRLLPGIKPRVFLEELQRIVDDPQVSFAILHEAEAAESPTEDPFYQAIVRHAQGSSPAAVAGPVLSVGFTDSLFLRQVGVHAYGLVPFAVPQALAATMHGEQERIPVAEIGVGLKILLGAVLDVSAQDAAIGGR